MAATEIENKPLTIRPDRPDGNPAWIRGGASPNPGGRPKGLAALVRSQTMEGAELVAFYLAIMRGTKRIDKRAPPLALRMDAAAWLADRAFGKPPQQLEHGGAEGGPLRIIIEYGEGAEDDAGSGYPAS